MKQLSRHMVHPAYMNHHGCLYGGTLAEWMTEAAFLAVAELSQSTAGVVLASIQRLDILRSTYAGSVLELELEGTSFGTTSITVDIAARDSLTREQKARGRFVFVVVDEEGHKRPHGLGNSAEAAKFER